MSGSVCGADQHGAPGDEQIVQHGSVRRGHIGVSIKDLTLAVGANRRGVEGALIAGVSGGSPAEHGGLQKGDVVIAADETPIRRAAALRNKLGLTPVGERVQLTVKRKGLSQKLMVEMAATDEIAQTGSVNWPTQLRTRTSKARDLTGRPAMP